MKSVYAAVVFAVLLVATPFASALSASSREEIHDKLISRLHSRQAGCATAACINFAQIYSACIQAAGGNALAGIECLCANKQSALACYSVWFHFAQRL